MSRVFKKKKKMGRVLPRKDKSCVCRDVGIVNGLPRGRSSGDDARAARQSEVRDSQIGSAEIVERTQNR